jgi:hypothetical protein
MFARQPILYPFGDRISLINQDLIINICNFSKSPGNGVPKRPEL